MNWLTLIFLACGPPLEPGSVDTATPIVDDTAIEVGPVDADGDGVPSDRDCDDSESRVSPRAQEVCDGLDNNCDGTVDEGFSTRDWYADGDGDGFGAVMNPWSTCLDMSATMARISGDCDDAAYTIHPDADEVCDGVDNDCDSLVDAADPELPGNGLWFPDRDGDGSGDATVAAVASCEILYNYVSDNTDCDDSDPTVSGQHEELCNGIDDNCDGLLEGEDECLCSWRYSEDGRLYAFCDTSAAWEDAQTECEALDMALITINDDAENQWATDTAMEVSNSGWWLGLNDLAEEGDWRWISGSSDYTAWNSGEPNNSGNEDCTELRSAGDGTWNDSKCTNTKSFICEQRD